MFKKIIKLLLYGGAFKTSNFEKWILNTVANNADPFLNQLIFHQAENITYVQRHNANKVIMLTVSGECNLIEPLGDSDGVCIAQVKIKYKNKRYISQIYTIRGKLRTIETNKSLPYDVAIEDLTCDAVDYFPQRNVENYTQQLDEDEHG